jgi:hypothetical protein
VCFILDIEHSPLNWELHDRHSSDKNVVRSIVIHDINIVTIAIGI